MNKSHVTDNDVKPPDRATHGTGVMTDNLHTGHREDMSAGLGVPKASGAAGNACVREVMTPQDVADYLHVSKSMAYKLLRDKDYKTFKVGTCLRIRKDDLIDALCGRTRR